MKEFPKHDIPAEVAQVLNEQQLEVLAIWRRGPRFWTGRVRLPSQDGQAAQEGVLKVVLDDWPWRRRTDQAEWHSSDQLLAEADVLMTLGDHRHRIRGHVPSILNHKRQRPAWTLRSMVHGRAVDLADNGFSFDPGTWRTNDISRLVGYIRDYQAVSMDLPDLAVETSQSDARHMSTWVKRLNLDNSAQALQHYSPEIEAYLETAVPWVASLPQVLVHGEVYPMHIFVHNADIALIDWENAQRGNELMDLVTFWIRGATMPDWQASFKAEAAATETLLDQAEFEKLWDFMVVSSATGTVRHLELAPEVTPAYREAAISELVRAVMAALKRG